MVRHDEAASPLTLGPRLQFGATVRSIPLAEDGEHTVGVVLHVDHVMPLSPGGATSEDNLLTACEACNLVRGSWAVVAGGALSALGVVVCRLVAVPAAGR